MARNVSCLSSHYQPTTLPTVPPGALVLVTGASGFLGTYIVSALLKAKFRVRITARSEEKAAHVLSLFPEADIDVAIVSDMVKVGAYDAAVRGIHAVIHAASPLDGWNKGSPELVIGPAVAGVRNLLESVHKHAPDLLRFVQISSIAAVDDHCVAGATYTEADWNEDSVIACETLGAAADPWDKYNASKTLAERAFWEYMETKPGFDGVSINPSLILAPPMGFSETDALTGSVGLALNPWLKPGIPEAELYKKTSSNIVDARDVALSCVRALVVAEAGGERFILSAAPLFGNDIALCTKDIPGLTRGNSDSAFRESLLPFHFYVDGAKAESVLGFRYRSKDVTIHDTLTSVRDRL